MVVKTNALLIDLEPVQIAHKTVCAHVFCIGIYLITHSGKCINDDTTDNGDEDEHEKEPIRDIPKETPYEGPSIYRVESIDDVRGKGVHLRFGVSGLMKRHTFDHTKVWACEASARVPPK